MVSVIRPIRVLLILLFVVVALFLAAHLSGRVLINDHRLARAVAMDATNPSDISRQELDRATVACQRGRAVELFAALGVLLFSAGGVVIRRGLFVHKPSNQAMQLTASKPAVFAWSDCPS